MKKVLLLTLFTAALYAESTPTPSSTTVVIVNINTALVSLLHNAAGFSNNNPYAEILIVHPSLAVDGYRIHITYYDNEGVKHEVLRDALSPATSDDRPMLEVFWIDAATISATVTPYKLQRDSIATQ
jgi:hypothetical protein